MWNEWNGGGSFVMTLLLKGFLLGEDAKLFRNAGLIDAVVQQKKIIQVFDSFTNFLMKNFNLDL